MTQPRGPVVLVDPPKGDWTGESVASHLGLPADAVLLRGGLLDIATTASEKAVRKALKTYPGPPSVTPDRLVTARVLSSALAEVTGLSRTDVDAAVRRAEGEQ